jgi:hypothetical protein
MMLKKWLHHHEPVAIGTSHPVPMNRPVRHQ